MQSTTPEPPREEEISVTLKPFLGMPPRLWLSVLLGVIVLALIFAVAVWPGISSPGTKVIITSTPSGAAVFWQGKLYGATPITTFFPQGSGELTLQKPGFQPASQAYSSKGQLFLSLLLPRTDKLHLKLAAVSPQAVLELFRHNLAQWVAAAPFSSVYNFPPLFTNFVEDARAAGVSDQAIRQELFQERRFVADPQVYANYGKACGLWNAQPPAGLEAQVKLWTTALGSDSFDHGRLVFWVLENQAKELRNSEVASPEPYLAQTLSSWQTSLTIPEQKEVLPGSLLHSAGFTFEPVPSGTYRWGYERPQQSLPADPPYGLPELRTVAGFWLASHEVTQAQFARFTAANPEWAPSHRAELVAAHKVDEQYLANWKGDAPSQPSAPVSEVSWFAAQAYTAWLNSSRLLPSGKQAVLPSEVQWEWAARGGQPDANPIYKPNTANSLGLFNMQDSVWEWTASSWAPADQLVDEANPPDDLAWFRTVKGGCNLNAGKIQVWERGVLAPDTCNDQTGFRVALVPTP